MIGEFVRWAKDSPVTAAVRRWIDGGGSSQAAALTFFSLFAIGPLLTLSLALASDLLGGAQAQSSLRDLLVSVVNERAAESLVALLERQENPSLQSVYTVNGVLLLFGAGAFMRQLREALSAREPDETESKQRPFILVVLFNRLVSLGLVVGSGVLLVSLSVLSALVSGVLAALDSRLQIPSLMLPLLDASTTILVAMVCLVLLYRFVPKARPPLGAAARAAALIALLFVAGKTLLGYYLARAPWGTTYGAAGSLVMTLVWLFITSNLMLIGNELAQEWRRRAEAES